MIEYICFDLDGTLLNTIAGICEAANEALSKMGMPLRTIAEYKKYIGYGPRSLAGNILPEDSGSEAVEEWLFLYKKCYLEKYLDNAAPFPGLEEALLRLQARGICLTVLSNKPHDIVTRQIGHFFPGIFDEARGQRDSVRPKPDPFDMLDMAASHSFDCRRCAYVGDMPVDIFTARNAGFYPVGVLWGFDREGLKRLCGDSVELLRSTSKLLRIPNLNLERK